MTQPFSIILYSGPQCHLCDLANELLAQSHIAVAVEKVSVKSDPALFHLYGARIPVLRRTDNQQELGWPFDAAALKEFLS